ncbi:Probable PE family protein [Mycobacteroides abscessus subsp. abscessus]|uniref:type VII secretion protein EsxS n=1 Tax=Mycobacteroides abscessus TaxID=36809 RepID=UPI00092C1AF0|nr:type VII secretion protein EsxS [Mycobacteroides abscessus]SIJ21999.1 Probable PE family protein [Mycobacteroides abscessus subsp. abscessus]SLH38657.1 Probable PE family protein [Mycobacteroides abscessus subsp. abscessus]
MSFLDVQVPQVVNSQMGFGSQAALMRNTISTAESEAQGAQGFSQGDFAQSFQTAHMRFAEAAQKINALLDVAEANLGENAGTYVAQDSSAASDVAGSLGALGGHA